LWTLPGGWADVNQSPSEAIVKEIREESGFESRVVKLVAVLDRRLQDHPPSFQYVYKLYFLCELTGGSAALSVETDGVDFFAEDALPPLSIQRITLAQIQRMFRHQRERALPTEFD
jgi:ADP-ribose pyrophosphatase YjhB (NUDIX family)